MGDYKPPLFLRLIPLEVVQDTESKGSLHSGATRTVKEVQTSDCVAWGVTGGALGQTRKLYPQPSDSIRDLPQPEDRFSLKGDFPFPLAILRSFP
jgi:hypothetical protein